MLKNWLHAKKLSIIKRLNERIASIVRHTGLKTEEYNRWAGKLSRTRSPYKTRIAKYNPSKAKTKKNKGKEEVEFIQLSRKKADIDVMELADLERLERQTRGWGQVKQEARQAIKEQWKATENPFEDISVSDDMIKEYLNQKEVVRQFIEGNSDNFYALIEATGWDDIREHTTEEIYNEVMKLDMSSYEFQRSLNEIGEDYKRRRDAARERRRELGI